MDKGMKYGGFAATGLYALAISVYAFWNWSQFASLVPNEVGDFLAGVFSPLAFLWLVLGYFQQGQELRQNNEALRLQAAELKNSVEQQKELVAVTREQVTIEMENINQARNALAAQHKPLFVLGGAGGSHSGNKHNMQFTLSNLGAPVTDVHLSFGGPMTVISRHVEALDSKAVQQFKFTFDGDGSDIGSTLVVSYLDSNGARGESHHYIWAEVADRHPALKFRRLPNQ